MGKKALIHIGSGKTGSSAIQSSLSLFGGFENIVYPMVEGIGHQNIEVLFRNRESLNRGIKTSFVKGRRNYEDYLKSFENCLLQEIGQDKDLVLSSEFLFSFSESEAKSLRKFLEELGFTEFLIVVYLRRPDSYYLSFVQQQLKASSTITTPKNFKCSYQRSIARWSSIFGHDSVMVREFSKSSLVGGDVVLDFSRLISQYFGEDVSLISAEENTSISSEGMVILQEFRQRYLKSSDGLFEPSSNKLLGILQKIKVGAKPKLKPFVVDIINYKCAGDIRYLQDNYKIFRDIECIPEDIDFCSADICEVSELIEGVDKDSVNDVLMDVVNQIVS